MIGTSNNKLLPTSFSADPSTSQSAAPALPPRSQQALRDSSSTTYVAVDAATQYSPMEPHDYFMPGATAKSTTPTDNFLPNVTTRDHVSSQPDLVQDNASDPSYGGASNQSSLPSTPVTVVQQPPMLKALPPQSPHKRRNSQGHGTVMDKASSSPTSQSLPKRMKPETAPPKVLPVRYDLCAIEDIVVLIADMLSELIETNDSLAMRSGSLTRFHSR